MSHGVSRLLESSGHLAVLLREVLTLLRPRPGETYVDLTLGRGGHAEAVARAVGPAGRVVGFDLDPMNVAYASQRLNHTGPTIMLHHASFVDAPALLARDGVAADMVLADLGFASTQMDDPSRGFSFRTAGPLDMRLDPTRTLTAADLVNTADQRELADLIYRYGEEPLSRKIAAEIVARRRSLPINTTADLADAVRAAYGRRAHHSRIHPATKTFMALRIAVNDELGALESMWRSIRQAAERLAIDLDLDRDGHGEARNAGGDSTTGWTAGKAPRRRRDDATVITAASAADRATTRDDSETWLQPGARIAFISFHSLEDRIVKHAMADLVRRGVAHRLTRKPVVAGDEETAANPRARSAKLRAIQLLGGDAAPRWTTDAQRGTAGDEEDHGDRGED